MTEEEKAQMAARMRDAMPVMRKTLKLTQSELSAMSGVSRSVISNAERGKQKLGWDTFLALSSVFRSNPTCDKLFDAFGIHLEQLNDYLSVNK